MKKLAIVGVVIAVVVTGGIMSGAAPTLCPQCYFPAKGKTHTIAGRAETVTETRCAHCRNTSVTLNRTFTVRELFDGLAAYAE